MLNNLISAEIIAAIIEITITNSNYEFVLTFMVITSMKCLLPSVIINDNFQLPLHKRDRY
jgi:hypothetical protein